MRVILYVLYANSKVNNPTEAYLLGFIYADGYVTSCKGNRCYVLGITLSAKDEDFLKQIQSIIGGKFIKKKQGKYEIVRLTVCDVELVQRLMSLGIARNKTYENNDVILQNIASDWRHHFIRGFFDGDGSIYRADKNTFGVGIVTLNVKLLNAIQKNICEKCAFSERPLFLEKGKYARLRYKGNQRLIKLRDFLYDKATLYLARKKEKFDALQAFNGRHGAIGLHWYRRNQKWGAVIKRKFLGLFAEKADAIEAIHKQTRDEK